MEWELEWSPELELEWSPELEWEWSGVERSGVCTKAVRATSHGKRGI